MLRRVQLKSRHLEHGESPWSIRQTGVYQSLRNTSSVELKSQRSTFILIAPSEVADRQISDYLAQSKVREGVSACNIHRILVGDSLTNWMDYMSYLEDKLRDQVSSMDLGECGWS